MSKHSAAQPNNQSKSPRATIDLTIDPLSPRATINLYPCDHEFKKKAKNNFAYCKCEFLAWYGPGSGDTAWKEAPEWKREWFPDLDRPRSSSCGPLGTDGGNMTFGGFCAPAGTPPGSPPDIGVVVSVTPIGGSPTPTVNSIDRGLADRG